jgi:decaprenyl-phosphate phosphoribosyltransferase
VAKVRRQTMSSQSSPTTKRPSTGGPARARSAQASPARIPFSAGALLRTSRPRQWTKNLLVFSVPAAAGELGHWNVLRTTGLAFVAFCLVSSAGYLLNDAADAEADRRHPVKRFRPIAAGELSVRTARFAAGLAFVLGFAIGAAVSWRLLLVIVGYVVLTASYTRYLKHVPIFDIATVAAGFFLRAVAGGVASNIYISRWFLIVAGAGSLFLISGKRYAELKSAGELAERTRTVLSQYSTDYLQALLGTTAGVTVLAYCIWAFEGSPHHTHPSGWTAVSAVPFVLGIMRYGLLLEHGHGEEPEEVFGKDRQLIALGAVWLALLLLGTIA